MLILLANAAHAQDVLGSWKGKLNVPGSSLTIIFNISKTEAGYQSTMDSPDQQAQNIPVTKIIVEANTVKLEIPAARMSYTATMRNDSLIGTFVQGGFQTSLNMVRSEPTVLKRPQEPKPPYSYHSEEVSITSAQGVVLSGTLTLPNPTGKQPVVVLISGSGPQNRDSELFGHKPFLVLADYLTRNGIGVLRYDDRGVGKSTGNFGSALTEDFAHDATAAVSYLKTRKEVVKNGIGLIGHSEGGVIAPMVASRSKDVQYVILLAGSGLQGSDLMLLQKKRIEEVMGVDSLSIAKGQEIFRQAYSIITASDTTGMKANVKNILNNAFGQTVPSRQIMNIYNQLMSPWMVSFLRIDPAPYLKNVKVPILIMNGDRDLQVPAAENTTAIEAALRSGGNKRVTTKRYPTLNHLFQEATTGSLSEYQKIEQTFSLIVMQDIVVWIKSVTGR